MISPGNYMATPSFSEQLNTANQWHSQAVDAGICNGRYFINGVGIGFDGAVVKGFLNCRKWMQGNLAYYWTVLQNIIGLSIKAT